MTKRVLVLPGDGIGPEIVAEAVKVLDHLAGEGLDVELDEGLIGGAAYDAAGSPLPESTLAMAREADAVLLGAVGGPKWEPLDIAVRPEKGLLGLRAGLGLFSNLRPAILYPQLASASSLRPEIVSGLDIMIVRELTGGIYFGTPKGVDTDPDGNRRGVNTMVYTEPEIERIARLAFEMARQRRGKVTSVDKANVLEVTELWRDIVTKLHKDEYSDVELNHMYVDNAAMQLIRNPRQFDVLVTGNLFGDILSDEAAMLTGSIGLLPSASLGKAKEGGGPRLGMYEPVHGSAPDITGTGKANPLAMILTAGMLFTHAAKRPDIGEAIDNAVAKALEKGLRTADIARGDGVKVVGCKEMGEAVLAALEG